MKLDDRPSRLAMMIRTAYRGLSALRTSGLTCKTLSRLCPSDRFSRLARGFRPGAPRGGLCGVLAVLRVLRFVASTAVLRVLRVLQNFGPTSRVVPVRSVFQTGSGVPAWRTSRRSLRGLAVVRHCCPSRTFRAGLAGLAGLAPVLLPSGGLPGWIGLPAWRAVVAVSTRRAVVQSCSLAGISCCASCGRASCWSCVRVLPPSAWPFRSGSEDSGPGAPRGGLCCPASRPPGAFHTGSGIRLARPTAVLRSRWCPASRGLPGWLGSLRPGAPSRRLVRSCSSCWSCCAVLLVRLLYRRASYGCYRSC